MLSDFTRSEICFAVETLYVLLPRIIMRDCESRKPFRTSHQYGKSSTPLAIQKSELRFFPASGKFQICSDEELGELALFLEKEAGTDMGILDTPKRLQWSFSDRDMTSQWYIRFPAYPRVLFCVRTIPCEDDKTGVNIHVIHEPALLTQRLFQKEGLC